MRNFENLDSPLTLAFSYLGELALNTEPNPPYPGPEPPPQPSPIPWPEGVVG